MTFKFTSHKDEVLEALKDNRLRGLEAVGAKAAGYADRLAPRDTGRLHNSITWATQLSEGRSYTYTDDGNGQPKKTFTDNVGGGIPDDTVVIGTNVEYAAFQEIGASKTDAHPFLRPAIENHLSEYEKILKKFLTGG
jgi:HK97 gp10 family phage protein